MNTYLFLALTFSTSLVAVTDLGQSLATGAPGEAQRLLAPETQAGKNGRDPRDFMGSVAGSSEDGRTEHTTVTLGNTLSYREDSVCVTCFAQYSLEDDSCNLCNKDSCCVEACCSPLGPVLSCGGLCPNSRLFKAFAWSTGTLGGGAFALWAFGILF